MRESVFTKKFFKDLAERTARTFVQGAASYLTLMGLDLIKADLQTAVIGAAAAGGYAVLTALVAAFKNPEQQSASLLDQPVGTEPGRHDGSQPFYDAARESYTQRVGQVEPDMPVRSPLPPSQPMGFVAKPLTGSPFQGLTSTPPLPPGSTRQRDARGRFLPRDPDGGVE